MKKIKTDKRGSVALTGILLITAVLMIVVLSISEANISAAQRQMNNESKKLTYYGAEACMEEVMIRLKRDPSFTGAEMMLNETQNCKISVLNSYAVVEIEYASYERRFEVDYELTTDGHANNIKLSNWREIQ